MRHPNSIDLLTYWNAKRGKRPFPARRDIEPADISKHLPHVLIGEIGEEEESDGGGGQGIEGPLG